MAQITQETLNSIMELYHSGKLEEAEAKVKELLSESPNEIAILNILGIIQDAKKEYEEAIKTYKKALDLNTDVPETHFNMGSLLQRQGKNEGKTRPTGSTSSTRKPPLARSLANSQPINPPPTMSTFFLPLSLIHI